MAWLDHVSSTTGFILKLSDESYELSMGTDGEKYRVIYSSHKLGSSENAPSYMVLKKEKVIVINKDFSDETHRGALIRAQVEISLSSLVESPNADFMNALAMEISSWGNATFNTFA